MQEKHEVIKERLRFVRERMKAENVDIFVVFTDDYHMSEYSGAYFADREYLSGFTGSARSEERRVGKECRSRWSPYH